MDLDEQIAHHRKYWDAAFAANIALQHHYKDTLRAMSLGRLMTGYPEFGDDLFTKSRAASLIDCFEEGADGSNYLLRFFPDEDPLEQVFIMAGKGNLWRR